MLKTLKGRLYFLSILIVIPFYFFIYLSFDYSRTMVENELLKSAQIVSNQAVENHKRLMTSTERFLALLADFPQVQKPNSEVCQRFISEIAPLYERYVNIGIPNKDGILTCNGTLLASPIDLSDRAYINDALTQDRFTISGVHMDRTLGISTVNFAYPVHSLTTPSTILGAVVAAISLDWWSVLLNSNELPENSFSYILDSHGNSIASYPEKTIFDDPKTFNVVIRSDDGIRRVFVQHHVTGWNGQVLLTFITGIAVEKSLSTVEKRYTWIASSFSILVVFMLIFLRYFFFNTISKPLNRLSDLAMRLGQNKPLNAALATGVEEMDDLQNRFLEMAANKAEIEKKIIQQSQIDSLTGISNRDALNLKLAEMLRTSQENHKVGVVLLDLDNFKEVNDTQGHEAGDNVLKTIATRLLACAPSAQLISRLGGDEFILLFEGETVDKDQILALSESIRKAIKVPFTVDYNEVLITASIGVAFYPDDGKNLNELMVAADQAMYLAKHRGRDIVERFNWRLKEALVHKTELIQDLRHAILHEEFYLLYQPIINQQGDVIKFEALIRWQHPKKGMIPPDQFIQAAEESGQIVEIGHWVIQEANRALEPIRQVYGDAVKISVNVSPIQLSKQQSESGQLLAELLSKRTDSKGPNGLVVEITEHLLMNSDESTRKALLAFREEGVEVALDDFGTGHSSLAYIMTYDIDYLKIDIKFVQKLEYDQASKTLCEAIISMAHALGIVVIAEGVETQKQADLLLEYGCDYLQGYYFSKPIPLSEVLTYKQDKLLAFD